MTDTLKKRDDVESPVTTPADGYEIALDTTVYGVITGCVQTLIDDSSDFDFVAKTFTEPMIMITNKEYPRFEIYFDNDSIERKGIGSNFQNRSEANLMISYRCLHRQRNSPYNELYYIAEQIHDLVINHPNLACPCVINSRLSNIQFLWNIDGTAIDGVDIILTVSILRGRL